MILWYSTKTQKQNAKIKNLESREYLRLMKVWSLKSKVRSLLVWVFVQNELAIANLLLQNKQLTNQKRFGAYTARHSSRKSNLWPEKWTLFHDNACFHAVFSVQRFEAEKKSQFSNVHRNHLTLPEVKYLYTRKYRHPPKGGIIFMSNEKKWCNMTAVLKGFSENYSQRCFQACDRCWNYMHIQRGG